MVCASRKGSLQEMCERRGVEDFVFVKGVQPADLYMGRGPSTM